MESHIELRTRLERFLHTTWLGGKITHVFWDFLAWFSAFGKTDGFYALCNEGKIKLIAPARVVRYAGNGESVLLSNGTEIKVNAVLLATGFGSSWTNIFAQETAKELGIGRHPPLADVEEHVWDYTEEWVSSIYRGIVPARNINHRDFAINGALSTTNNGYAFEVMAHWISSYFLGDKMRLPSSPEEATKLAGKNAAWIRRRFPGMPVCVNQSNNSEVAFWPWPQAMDDLLEDMGVPIMRSGGNWLTWPFKVITPAEIKNLREERRAKREMDLKAVN
ncbi:hypothetical protein F5141DRAFT_1099920 [Pisolithus sp. B1]|nr:hypothetical protein F5141DRAFT_1099920 [Pisolithus sp. B1]